MTIPSPLSPKFTLIYVLTWDTFSFQMLSLLEHMYNDLGLIEYFEINAVVLRRFLVSKLL